MCSSLEIRMLCSQLEFLCQNQDQLSQFLKCDLRFKLLCSNFDCVVKKDKEFNLKEQTEKEEQEEVTQGHEDREKEVDSALLVRLSLQLISTLVQQIHQESLDESGTQLFILLTACVARFGSVNDFQLLINQSFENQSIPAKVQVALLSQTCKRIHSQEQAELLKPLIYQHFLFGLAEKCDLDSVSRTQLIHWLASALPSIESKFGSLSDWLIQLFESVRHELEGQLPDKNANRRPKIRDCEQFTLELIASIMLNSLSESTKQTCLQYLRTQTMIMSVVEKCLLNTSNGITRKRARHVAVTLNWIDLTCCQMLETLEETQVHLVKPVLDSLLPNWQTNSNLAGTLKQPELVLRRMFDHSNRAIKRYAINFLGELYKSQQQQFWNCVSKRFILEQVFEALQDNPIYGDGLPDECLAFLRSFSINQVLRSLLVLENRLSPFSLYYVTRQMAIVELNKHSDSNEEQRDEPFLLSSIEVQRLFQAIQRVCAEPFIRGAIQIQLLQSVQNRLKNNQNQQSASSLFNMIGCLKLKEIRSQCLHMFDSSLAQFATLLDSESIAVPTIQITGVARFLASHSKSATENFIHIMQSQWTLLPTPAKHTFTQNFTENFTEMFAESLLSSKCSGNTVLSNFLEWFLSEDQLQYLDPLCQAEVCQLSDNVFKRLSDFIISQMNSNPFVAYSLYSKLTNKNWNDLQPYLDTIAIQLKERTVRFNYKNEACWTFIFDLLDSNQTTGWSQIKTMFFVSVGDETDAELLQELIQLVPSNFNGRSIHLFAKLLRNEITLLLAQQDDFDNDKVLTKMANQFPVLQNFMPIFENLFKSCMELRKKEAYRQTFYQLIREYAFAECLFVLDKKHLQHVMKFDQDERLERFISVDSLEVQSALIQHLCALGKKGQSLNLHLHSKLFLKVMQSGILFERKQLNLMQMLIERVSSEKNLFDFLQCEESPHFHREARLSAIVVTISHLNTHIPDFLNNLIDQLIKFECSLLGDEAASFPHSRIHRQQTKLWQFLVLLAAVTLKRQSSSTDQEKLLHRLYAHSTQCILDQNAAQLSVRYLQSLVLLVLMQDDFIGQKFRTQFSQLLQQQMDSRTSSVGCFQALLIVCYHLVQDYRSFEFFPAACLLSCHHYRVRLFGHLVMEQIDNRVHLKLQDTSIPLNTNPKAAANFTKNLRLLSSDWFYSTLKVKRDMSWQLLFDHFPRLTNCLYDDRLFVEQMQRSSLVSELEATEIPISSSNKALESCKCIRLFDRSFEQQTDQCDEDEETTLVDIFQRKCLIPLPDQPVTVQKMRRSGQLILCASLIDRAPNLGGLSRSCEIFGAKLLLPSLHFVQEKEFQQLSVSAHKWIPMDEVPITKLVTYLTKQRDQYGYRLIGVEQSTGSVCLTEFKFPEKSLLVLGNEKEGLPMQLLQMMDFCIEIPQCGYTRSLNVHVTGALCAWEYLKQYKSRFV